MRKMFSKNQIEKIVNDVLNSNEVLSKISYNSEDDMLVFDTTIKVISFDYIEDDDGVTIKNKLDNLAIKIEDEYLSENCTRVSGQSSILDLPNDFTLEDGLYAIYMAEPDGSTIFDECSLMIYKNGKGSSVGVESLGGVLISLRISTISNHLRITFSKTDGTGVDIDDYDEGGDNILYYCKLF